MLRGVSRRQSVNTVLPLAVIRDGDRIDSVIYEFCEETLAQRLKHYNSVMPPEVTTSFVRDLFTGLAHLHALGILHRDAKMDNLLLQAGAGAQIRLKLADYGWCTQRGSAHTPAFAEAYRAPEIIMLRPYGSKADVWAGGLVSRELITGRALWDTRKWTPQKQILHVCSDPASATCWDPGLEEWKCALCKRAARGESPYDRLQRDSVHQGAPLSMLTSSFLG